MTYEEAEHYIHSIEKFNFSLTLDRPARLMERLGNPQDKLAVLHVAGTNGKGSVCNLCANALAEAGYKTGLYTSPFVLDFRDRFQINGEMIPKAAFAAYTQRVRQEIEALNAEGVHISEFEAITALAFLWFAEEGCDFVVLEVGLGGRFDATNLVKKPRVCGIVSLSLDHVNILGDTIEKIAYEKAGIIKEGVPCCCYPKQHPAAEAVLRQAAADRHAPFRKPSADALTITRCDWRGGAFTYGGVDYTLKLVGEHQFYNALTALAMLEELQKQGVSLPTEAIRRGFAKTAFPGRFEILNDHPLVIDDGAHNEEGTAALARTLSAIPKEKYLLMGMLADKDYEDSLAHLGRVADHLFCVPVDSPRALPPEKFAQSARKYCRDVRVFQSREEAVDAVFPLLGKDDLLLGCGSLYLVGSLRALFLEKLKK